MNTLSKKVSTPFAFLIFTSASSGEGRLSGACRMNEWMDGWID